MNYQIQSYQIHTCSNGWRAIISLTRATRGSDEMREEQRGQSTLSLQLWVPVLNLRQSK